MLGKCCKKSASCKASARVVDGKLILSLPDATTPVVWQMDLGHAKASALEVRSNEEAGTYALVLKTPKGETVEIAMFGDRKLSVDGLMAASRALENAHGQIRPNNAANDGIPAANYSTGAHGAHPPTKRGKLMTVFLSLVVLFVLFVIWSMLMPIPATTNTAGMDSTQSGEPSGVPLDANDYLQQSR